MIRRVARNRVAGRAIESGEIGRERYGEIKRESEDREERWRERRMTEIRERTNHRREAFTRALRALAQAVEDGSNS